MTTQLALRFPHAPWFRAADLLANPAQDVARTWLAQTAEWPMGRLVLWGAAGSGKSHLLHAWAEGVGGAVLTAAPRGGWPQGPIAIDGVDRVGDEEALLHLLNAAAEAGYPVLLSATVPPGRLRIRLPDLASRLRSAMAVEIGAAPDAFLGQLLARLLADRQLPVPAALQSWLLTRLPRNPAALRLAVDRLDAAGLESGRAITRALAAAALGLHDSSGSSDPDTSPSAPGAG